MRKPLRLIVAFCTIFAVSACTLPRGAAIESEVIRNQNDENASFSVVPVKAGSIEQVRQWPATGWAGHYHWFSGTSGPKSNIIRAGDTIDLVIWDNQESSLLTSPTEKSVQMNNLRVSPEGTIFVPYINEVRVGGNTPERARDLIEERLEIVVPDAQVQLSLTPGADNSVNAVRGFASPGTYPLPSRDYSVLTLISQAGGIAPDLENPLVRVSRGGKNYEIRADTLFQRASANVVLRGGDQVSVEEDGRFFVALGATGSETIVPFETETVTAIEALALLGGINDTRANPKGILILREYSRKDLRSDGTGPVKQQVVFTIDLTSAEDIFAARKFQINPKDLVMATESPINSVRTVLGLFGSAVGVTSTVSNVTN